MNPICDKASQADRQEQQAAAEYVGKATNPIQIAQPVFWVQEGVGWLSPHLKVLKPRFNRP